MNPAHLFPGRPCLHTTPAQVRRSHRQAAKRVRRDIARLLCLRRQCVTRLKLLREVGESPEVIAGHQLELRLHRKAIQSARNLRVRHLRQC